MSTTFVVTAKGQGVNTLTLDYPQPVNAAQIHHIVIGATNVQNSEGPIPSSIAVEVWALPDPEYDASITLNPIGIGPGPTFIGEGYRYPRLREADTGIEIRLPPGITADLIVSLDEQNEGGQAGESEGSPGQTFEGDLSSPDPPGVNPWYYSGEWITAFSEGAPNFTVPPGWTMTAQEANGAATLTVFRKDIEPWVTQDQLVPSGMFDSGVPQTIWLHTSHLKGANLFLNPYEVLAQPGETFQVNVGIDRGPNAQYQGTLEFALIPSPYVSASIEPQLAPYPVDVAVMTVQVASDAPRGSHQYVGIGNATGTGLEFFSGVQILVATESGGGPPPPQTDLYRRFQRDLAPPWLQAERGRAFHEELGTSKDRLVDLLLAALRARVIELAPEDALTLIGDERGLPRYPGEDLEPYRKRLLAAWEFWRWGGTKKGIEDALAVLGYQAQAFELFRAGGPWALYHWAEFNVILRPTAAAQPAPLWGDDGIWTDDGSLWGTQLTAAEAARILGVLNQVKAAHSVYNIVFYVIGGAIWGEESEGNWQDDGVWEDGEVIELYRRN